MNGPGRDPTARRRWIALVGVAVVLVAAGAFFAIQPLGTADQYASVASFLLALIVAAAAMVDRLRHPSPSAPPMIQQGARTANNCGTVVIGDNADVTATVHIGGKQAPPPVRPAKPHRSGHRRR